MGFFQDLFSGGAEKEAAEKNRGLLNTYQNQGYGFLDQGLGRSTGAINDAYGTAQGYLGQAGQAYSPLAALGQKYGAGSQLALDAYGAGGAAGNQRALDAFQAGPGYQFAQDQGQQAVERRRAVAGGWNSGNTDIDLLKFSQGLADQEYGNWRTGLGQFISPELAAISGAAAGQAGVYGQQAGLATGRGNTLAGLYSTDADNRTNILGSVTSGGMQANNSEAAGRSAGARNLLGAGLSLASLATGAIGGMGGLGGIGNMTSQAFGNGTGYQTNPWSSGGMFGSGGSGWGL